MKTIDIKGKAYVEVNERIKYFREIYPTGAIIPEIVSLQDGVCVMKSTVSVDGDIKAVGHAYEKEGSTFINKTSYIENCETSAVGRALGLLGIGIDTSIASYEEVATAIENQKPKKSTKSDKPTSAEMDALVKHAEEHGKTYEDLEEFAQKGFKTTLLKITKTQYTVMWNKLGQAK